MSFNFRVNLNDAIGYSYETELIASMNEALADYSGHMSGQGTLVTTINLGDAGAGRADGSSTVYLANGLTEGGQTLVQPGSIYTLLTGQHPNDTPSDITINLDRDYLPILHFGDEPVPYGRVDATSVLRHELQHSFGMVGYIQNNGESLANGTLMTAFDTFIDRYPDGSAFFTGPATVDIYGGPVPLTTTSETQNFYHLGNGYSDSLVNDLMNGVYFSGQTYEISNLDLAILREVGAPVTDLNGVDFRPATQPPATTINVTSESAGNAPQVGTDWNAIGTAMTHYNEATGQWWGGDFDGLLAWDAAFNTQTPAQVNVAASAVDWDAIAAEVTQHYNETGVWG